MATLVVKNLPDNLHERLKQIAKRNHRSVTKEVVRLIEAGVAAQPEAANRPAPITVKGARAMTREELEAALADDSYAHLESLDDLEKMMDELRADRDDIRF
jgi:plasmid stability protein